MNTIHSAIGSVRLPRARWTARSVCRLLIATALSIAGVTSLTQVAEAAPASYYTLPGAAGQPIVDLTAAPDGTLWLVRREGESGRVLHVDGAGDVLATSASIEGLGGAGLHEMVAASTGVWVTGGPKTVDHVALDGSVTAVIPGGSPVPVGAEAQTLVAGADGRGWYLSCQHGRPETCSAVAAPVGGAAQEYPVPPLDVEWPSGSSGSWLSWGIGTEAGAWFEKVVRVDLGPVESHLAFVSGSGESRAVTIPAGALIVAPAGPESVWWLSNEGAAGATVGRVDSNGMISATRHLANLSDDGALTGFIADPGPADSVLWAQNATWSDTYDGQIGEVAPDGSAAEYKVPYGATFLPTSEQDFWSGNCTFGVQLQEAADGSLWTITGGHPPRVTRQQPSGVFETFALGGLASEFVGEKETGISGMVETGPRALYFSLNTPTGPEIAKVDPLDPPPAAPRYSAQIGSSAKESGSSASAGRVARVQIRAFLAGLLKKARKAVARGGKATVVSVRLPEPGTVTVLAQARSGHRWRQFLHSSVSGSGVRSLRIDPASVVTPPGGGKRPAARLTVKFKPLHGAWSSRTAAISLPRGR